MGLAQRDKPTILYFGVATILTRDAVRNIQRFAMSALRVSAHTLHSPITGLLKSAC
jgi:hypothetical protein